MDDSGRRGSESSSSDTFYDTEDLEQPVREYADATVGGRELEETFCENAVADTLNVVHEGMSECAAIVTNTEVEQKTNDHGDECNEHKSSRSDCTANSTAVNDLVIPPLTKQLKNVTVVETQPNRDCEPAPFATFDTTLKRPMPVPATVRDAKTADVSQSSVSSSSCMRPVKKVEKWLSHNEEQATGPEHSCILNVARHNQHNVEVLCTLWKVADVHEQEVIADHLFHLLERDYLKATEILERFLESADLQQKLHRMLSCARHTCAVHLLDMVTRKLMKQKTMEEVLCFRNYEYRCDEETFYQALRLFGMQLCDEKGVGSSDASSSAGLMRFLLGKLRLSVAFPVLSDPSLEEARQCGLLTEDEYQLIARWRQNDESVIEEDINFPKEERSGKVIPPEPVVIEKARLEHFIKCYLESEVLQQGQMRYILLKDWFHKYEGGIDPGQIDNTNLLDDNGEIKSNVEYMDMTMECWDLLVSYFGLVDGQNPIIREVIELDSEMRIEEVLWKAKVSATNNLELVKILKFSRSSTVDEIIRRIKDLFSISMIEKSRLLYSPNGRNDAFTCRNWELSSRMDENLPDHAAVRKSVRPVDTLLRLAVDTQDRREWIHRLC